MQQPTKEVRKWHVVENGITSVTANGSNNRDTSGTSGVFSAWGAPEDFTKENKMPENVTSTEPTAIDWARLAAFIDGEGCISITAQNRPKRKYAKYLIMQILLGGVDPRLALWCKSVFGVGHTFTRKAPKNSPRPFFAWLVTGNKAAAILRGCYPYFLLKQEQADIALAFNALQVGQGRRISDANHTQRMSLKQQLSALKVVTPVTEALQ